MYEIMFNPPQPLEVDMISLSKRSLKLVLLPDFLAYRNVLGLLVGGCRSGSKLCMGIFAST